MARVKVTISDAYELYRKRQIIELLLITLEKRRKSNNENALINDRAQSVMHCTNKYTSNWHHSQLWRINHVSILYSLVACKANESPYCEEQDKGRKILYTPSALL